jgi:transcriptional regulator with XRE-family HTH domain
VTDRRANSPACRLEIDPASHRQALLGAIRERCATEQRPFSAVAIEAGLSEAELAAVESGQADLRLNELTAISEALGVKASELIARAEALRREVQ